VRKINHSKVNENALSRKPIIGGAGNTCLMAKCRNGQMKERRNKNRFKCEKK
jgi:hypothetical protein